MSHAVLLLKLYLVALWLPFEFIPMVWPLVYLLMLGIVFCRSQEPIEISRGVVLFVTFMPSVCTCNV